MNPPARTMPHWALEAALLIGFGALLAWAAPDLAAWLHTWWPR
jgi:hypothetical protein